MNSRSSRLALAALLALVGACSHGRTAHETSNAVPAAPAAPATAATPAISAAPAVVSDQRRAGPEDFDTVLKHRVKGEFVDYKGWKESPEDMALFDSFLRWQAEADVAAMPREDQIAFYVNAYNACCIKHVLDHYPVHTPMDVDGFFDKLKCRVGREDLTVNDIEYQRLIPRYQDMRTHFAIVCSDRGCPPLRAGAYTGATLDADLEAAARRFVADPRNLKVDAAKGEVQISKLFEWYGKDFTADPTRPAARPEAYLARWADADTKRLLDSGNYQVKIIEWNWTLNEKR